MTETTWRSRRRATRHKAEIDVNFGSGNRLYVGCTENMSAGGVFVRCGDPLPPIGSQVLVGMVPLGETEQATVLAEVRWHRRPLRSSNHQAVSQGFGARFTDVFQPAADHDDG